MLKNDLDIMPVNVKKRESLCGLLFISFLIVGEDAYSETIANDGVVEEIFLEPVVSGTGKNSVVGRA